MSEPAADRYDVTNLFHAAAGPVVHAVSDHPDETDAEYNARAAATESLIQSFQPRDAIDLILASQVVGCHEAFADAVHDILQGVEDTLKSRARSGLIALARITQGHLDRLEKRDIQPHRTEIAAPQPEQDEAPAAEAPPLEQNQAEPEPDDSATTPTVRRGSWLDQPYDEWVLETPAAQAAQYAVVAAPPTAPPPTPPDRRNGIHPAARDAPKGQHRTQEEPALAEAVA